MTNTAKKDTVLSPELTDLLANSRPIESLDLEGLATSIRELENSPTHVAETRKAVFVEDTLRALEEEGVSKSELARRLGKNRQQLSRMLNEESLNNFTIETMSRISTALGRNLFVRMFAKNEQVSVEVNSVKLPTLRSSKRTYISYHYQSSYLTTDLISNENAVEEPKANGAKPPMAA